MSIHVGLKNEILRVDLEEGKELNADQKSAVKVLIEQIHTFKRKNQRFRGNLSGAGKAKAKTKKEQQTTEIDQENEKDIIGQELVDIET